MFLGEMLIADGLQGESTETCLRCPEGTTKAATIRCDDCSGGELTCGDCCVLIHDNNEWHRIEVCGGQYLCVDLGVDLEA